MNPAIEWLSARLAKGSATPREVLDEAQTLGITHAELLDAKTTLGVTTKFLVPEAGGAPYRVWVATNAAPDLTSTPEATLTRADKITPRTKRDPKTTLQRAKDRLARKSLRYVRGIEELTTRIDKDPVACPTCGRGTKRSEEIRLRALTAALDRAGVVAPRSGEAQDDLVRGPLIVFPAGTRIAIVAETPQPERELRRADQVGG